MPGNFHDDTGGSGNAFLPIYTMPNGDVTTVTKSTSTATAEAGDETTSAPVLASTTRASELQSETGGSQPSGASNSSSQTGSVVDGTQSSGSSGSSSVNAAPTQYTGAATSRSGVHAALLAVAALSVVVAAI